MMSKLLGRISLVYIKVLLTLTVFVAALCLLFIRYQVSITPAAVGCIPAKAIIIDSFAREPKRGQLMSFYSQKAEPYFANGTVFLKIAAAIEGDKVTVTTDGVTITTPDGEVIRYAVNASKMLEFAQIPAPAIQRTLMVGKGQYFALGTLERSFDSRYWGLVNAEQIIGVGYAFM